MILRALIEIWPSETGIYIDRLPGLYASGADEPSALRALPDAVEYHLAWLSSHGRFDSQSEPIEIEIAERLPAVDGAYGPLFAADREEPGPEDIEQGLRVAALGRRDLVDLYRSVSSVRRSAVPAAGGWSIARHLHHVADLDLHYASRLAGDPSPELPDDPVKALQTSAEFASRIVEDAAKQRRIDVIERDGEEWTLAKVLRRMSAHIREHEPWVRRIARSS